MNHTRFQVFSATFWAIALTAGCTADSGAGGFDRDLAMIAPQQASGSGVGVRIEQAVRKLSLGGHVKQARAALEALASDPAATADERDEARLELSVALETEGDREAAISTVEAVLAEHGDERAWAMEGRAESRLRQLLTGSPDVPRPWSPARVRQLAPFAGVLADYFPLAGGEAEVNIFAFGGNDEDTKRIGAFDIDRALRDQRHRECPLCAEEPNIHTSFARSGTWAGIPRYRARLGTSLAVYYMTLGAGRIPARYDAELPIASAAIAAHLEQGKGLFAARERKGGPPSIVIAAPREAQLARVEEALAAAESLPAEPVLIPLPLKLSAEEIQVVVRGHFPQYKGCYDALLAQNATASGRISLKFIIDPDGIVKDMTVGAVEGALADTAFQQCMVSASETLVFPAALDKTTVVYPILMTSGEDK